MPRKVTPRPNLYGFSTPILGLFQEPIKEKRAPTIYDSAEIGTTWCNELTNIYWILTSRAFQNNQWIPSSNGGGAGVFSSLTVNPGPTTLTGAFTVIGAGHTLQIGNDAAANTVVVGSTTGAASTTIKSGTGDLFIFTSATGEIFVGNAPMTGNLQIGNSVAGQNVFISGSNNTGAQTVNIASGASAANSTVNILTGNATAGTQTFNLMTGTRPGIMNLAVGNGGNIITIGNSLGTGATTIHAGDNGLILDSSTTGNITVGSAPSTGTLSFGVSTAGQLVNIANAINTGPQIVNIANGAAGASSTVNILSGNATAGAITLNLGNGNRSTTVNLGHGTGDNTILMGSTAGASLVSISAGTAGIFMNAPFVLLPNLIHLYAGLGAPDNALATTAGDFYIRADPAGATSRLYVATGANTWTNVTCAG